MRGKELLTKNQRREWMDLSELTEWELATYYTFSPDDLKIIDQHRRSHNRLGFAVQLCLLRYPGWSLTDVKNVPENALGYIARQIQVDPAVFNRYAERSPTRREHLREIRTEYGYRNFNLNEYRNISRLLVQHAMQNGHAVHLLQTAVDEMRRQKIIFPNITTIERLVWESRNRAEENIYRELNHSLSHEQKQKLDQLLESSMGNGTSPLGWLKGKPGNFSPQSFLEVIKRLDYIRQLKLNLDHQRIHPNRLRQLSRLGAKYDAHAFRRFKAPKRYSMLVAYLAHLSQDFIDQAIEIHDKQMISLQNKGKKMQDELQRTNGKAMNEKVVQFADIGSALIKARKDELDPFETLETVMPWGDMVASVEEARELSRPVDYDYLDLLDSRFTYLRRYTPTLLSSLELEPTQASKPLIKAIDTIREMNESGRKKIPDGAPLDFVPKRWEKHVYDEDGRINRHYYEMAALNELRYHVRSGDVAVKGSRQHKNFDDYLVSKKDWDETSPADTRLKVPFSFEEYFQERKGALEQRLKWVEKHADDLEGVDISNGKIHVDRLEKDTPEEAKQLSSELYGMIPKVKLTDLLMEVSRWTGFDKAFTHASTGHPPKDKEKPIVMATLMALGMNIGLTKMANATPGISYHQMANVSQWRMYDDAINKAQAELFNFHHKLPLPAHWGDGTTSSSDGMRVRVGVQSLYSDPNPHYGYGMGGTFYRFTSDQYSTFYGNVVNTNSRDALHVLDGLLHHETDVDIEEHYTDTAGYTDQVFGLCHLFGFRFAPRIRNLADTRLYTIGKTSEFPRLKPLLQSRINTKVIKENFDDVLRLAHSIGTGKVSAALILGKLGSYSRQNRLSLALQEIGKIEKTIFILDYLSDKVARRKIQRGLNKGEATNALARALFFAQRGELRERALQGQLQRNSALNVLINAVSIWNTVYLTQAIGVLKDKGRLNDELLFHISPLNWEHINFLGEYHFELKDMPSENDLRPLNI
ncbi:Tn3 family transposase [Virgibacillus sp. CBA3643]|uniref:Tn3 family transposase n=1 Tax=Virgibacillus sp. CBA3643 TaxID=2942278 RepID=UPI0035A270F8